MCQSLLCCNITIVTRILNMWGCIWKVVDLIEKFADCTHAGVVVP
jgi:hypothetical protein